MKVDEVLHQVSFISILLHQPHETNLNTNRVATGPSFWRGGTN